MTSPTPTDSIVGGLFITVGVAGAILNGSTATLMWTCKEMRNVTYRYMVHMCVSDLVMLLPLAVYAGAVLIWPPLGHDIAMMVAGYVLSVGWCSSCNFMILTAVSRWTQITRAHDVDRYFSAGHVRLTVAVGYGLPAVASVFMFCTEHPVFVFDSVNYAWKYDTDRLSGFATLVYSGVQNGLFAAVITVFNARSLLWIRRTRSQTQSLAKAAGRRREFKLLAQCAITGGAFTFGVVYYVVLMAAAKDRPATFLSVQLYWMVLHVLNAVLYIGFNNRLRRRFRNAFRPGSRVSRLSTTTL